MSPGPKKRKYVRIPVVILVDIYSPGSLIPKGRGCVINLSLGGIAIETETDIDVGSEIYLKLKLGEETYDIFGKILRKQLSGNLFQYGVIYTKLNIFEKFKFKKRLKLWIEKHKTESTKSN